MTVLTFQASVSIRGINQFVVIGASQAARLKPDWRKPLPVLIRINSKPAKACRTNLMPVGDGSFYLYSNGAMRKESGVSVGDLVHVEIESDEEYRNGPLHSMPPWFRQALRENPKAEQNWTALAPSRKKEILRYFARRLIPM